MRKLILAATTIAALAAPAAFAVPAMADNGSTGTVLTMTTTWQGQIFTHKYLLTTVNPSAHTFTGVSTDDNPAGVRETVTGSLQAQNITIAGAYDGTNYTWHYSGPLSGGTATDSYQDQSVHASFTTFHPISS